MTAEQILSRLQKLANPKNVEGMARFGISPENALRELRSEKVREKLLRKATKR